MCDFSPILLNYVVDVPVVLKVTLLLGVSNCISLLIIYIYIYIFYVQMKVDISTATVSTFGQFTAYWPKNIWTCTHVYYKIKGKANCEKLPTKLKIHPECTAQLLVNIRDIFMISRTGKQNSNWCMHTVWLWNTRQTVCLSCLQTEAF